MAQKSSLKENHWMQRLSRSGYFLGALLLHLVVFLMIATRIIFPPFVPPEDDFSKVYVPASQPPPPPATSTPTMPIPTRTLPNPTTAITTTAAAPSFNIPLPALDPSTATKLDQSITAPAVKTIPGLTTRLTSIKATVTAWGRDTNDIRNSNGDPKNIKADFPVYIASYADGDWDCNIIHTSGSITAGSIPNLVDKINEWSHGNIKGHVVPEPLDIGSPELLEKKPPFIFFTGHKDFRLTPTEIDNLRNYLQNGGAIWGDNALAGEGSRFDVAFRREMKRVIPDPDKNFEPVPLTHEIFTKSWFNITQIPTGMNYYAEPLLHIDLDGKLAIIYTPNDYSDLMFLHILPGDTEGDYSLPPKYPLYTNMQFYYARTIFFRNFELDSSLAVDRLGMNIIGFLLVRFDNDLLLTP
ncbi:DUF4159 domain-containing protein [Methylacidiphilales bacterium]|nr:DUF4159 domain-containing protein [Candidatus Methylacidiphilales bacterium]